MKQVVSPKLNDLLDKMDTPKTNKHSKNKIIPEVVNNIKKHDNSSAPLVKTGVKKQAKVAIPKTVTQKVASVSKKVLSQKITTTSRSANKDTKSSLQDLLNKAIKDVPKKTTQKNKNKKQGDVIKKQKVKSTAPVKKIKEIPEDVLRGIFE